MVWRDVHQDGQVSFEPEHAIQLETTDLQHIAIIFLCGYLHGDHHWGF